MIPGRLQARSQVIFVKVPRPFLTILGCPLGPGNHQKSTHGPTKCPGWRILSDFYSIFGLSHFFDWISDRTSWKSMFFSLWFFRASQIFFNLTILTKHCNLRIGRHFPMFLLCIFFIGKITKNQWKAATIEELQKITPGGIQNDQHFNVFSSYFGWTGENWPQKICESIF